MSRVGGPMNDAAPVPRWRPSIRWFFAELLVVITGILIALAAQSWWQNRGNENAERAYLEQLLADTRENEELLTRRITADSTARHRAGRMAAILRERLPLPPQDTMAVLARLGSTTFSLITATYDGLIATGDIKLLRNDSLRTATLYLGTQIHRSSAGVNGNVERLGRSIELRTSRFLAHVQPLRTLVPDSLDELDIDWWKRVDYAALQGDTDVMQAFQSSIYVLNNSLGLLRGLRAPLAEYRGLLERELATF
jgi:hypothetical protein